MLALVCSASLVTHPGQVGDAVQQRLEAGDLTGLLADIQLGQDQAGGVLHRGEQVDLPSPGLRRAAQGLAVHGQPAQPGALGSVVGEPSAHRPVQGVTVDAREQSADRRLGRHQPPGQHRIGPHAEPLQHLRRRVRDPLPGRQQRGRPGQHRARGQCEQDGQRMPHATWIARIRHRATARLLDRRVRRLYDAHVPEGQEELFKVYRFHAVFSGTSFPLVEAEKIHRAHAIVEQVFADLEAMPRS